MVFMKYIIHFFSIFGIPICSSVGPSINKLVIEGLESKHEGLESFAPWSFIVRKWQRPFSFSLHRRIEQRWSCASWLVSVNTHVHNDTRKAWPVDSLLTHGSFRYPPRLNTFLEASLVPWSFQPRLAVAMASLAINETGMEDCGIDDSFKYNLYSVVYSVVFVLGLITNCAALFVFCFRMKMRNETTMFMTNLALSDLVFVFTLPFKVFYNVNRHWPFGDGLCKVSGTAFITNIYGSMLFLTCISVDRFLAIVYPFRSRSIRTRRNAALVCAAVWLTIVGGGISVTFFSTINSTNTATTCFEGFSKSTWRNYLSKITIFIEVSEHQYIQTTSWEYCFLTLYMILFLFIDRGLPAATASQLGVFLTCSADTAPPCNGRSRLQQQETRVANDSCPSGHFHHLLCSL